VAALLLIGLPPAESQANARFLKKKKAGDKNNLPPVFVIKKAAN
jgi:hypothetical protein